MPVLAISDDKALTSTNVPWIFRLPSTKTPASAVALLRTAEGQSGSNLERLRDVLVSGEAIRGIAFLPTGEPHSVADPLPSQSRRAAEFGCPSALRWKRVGYRMRLSGRQKRDAANCLAGDQHIPQPLQIGAALAFCSAK